MKATYFDKRDDQKRKYEHAGEYAWDDDPEGESFSAGYLSDGQVDRVSCAQYGGIVEVAVVHLLVDVE